MSQFPLSGVGIVVDDQVFNPKTDDKIVDILKELKDKSVALLSYNDVLTDAQIKKLGDVSFALIDWTLLADSAGAEARQVKQEGIIRLIKALSSMYYMPIFVFSNNDEDDIKNTLKDNDLSADAEGSVIMVRNKSALCARDGDEMALVPEIIKWVESSLGMYVLSKWQEASTSAKNRMFKDFADKCPAWPIPFWNAYMRDGVNPAEELTSLLCHNFAGRLPILDIDSKKFKGTDSVTLSKKQVVDIYKQTVMIDGGSEVISQETELHCGDVLKCEHLSQKHYLLNISCDCDCVGRMDSNVRPCFLLGQEIDLAKAWSKEKGRLKQNVPSAYDIYPLFNDHICVRFSFRHMERFSLSDMISRGMKRVARILPPYITDVRQRCSAWLQREGFPKPPLGVGG